MKTSLLSELRKHAAYSKALRDAAITKSAGLLKGIGKVGLFAAKRPLATLSVGAGTMDAVARAKSTKASFDPRIQRMQLGIDENGNPLRGQ